MNNPSESSKSSTADRPRVVIVGGGFAGVSAAKALRDCPVDVLLIDRRNHHIFQPLLYQVATAVLAPADIAAPLRQLAEKQANLAIMMGEVTAVDRHAQTVTVTPPGLPEQVLPFAYLIVATGVHTNYFGRDDFAAHSQSLKTLTDAESIRGRILGAYERAEQTDDAKDRQRAQTFVLVGAGPTGVELAASIAQMALVTLRDNFRRIDPASTRIVLLEAGPRVLPSFDESLSNKAADRLRTLGVEVLTGTRVDEIDAGGVVFGSQRIDSATVLWTAGVQASPLIALLGAKTDRAGRAWVEPGLNLDGDPNMFVAGDAACLLQDGRPVPGVAQAAIQQGRYVGQRIAAIVAGRSSEAAFRYADRGNMAVVGKNFAILERGQLRTSGVATWFLWALLHVAFLPQLQNRLRVQIQWLWSYISGQRSSRLIPETPEEIKTPVKAGARAGL